MKKILIILLVLSLVLGMSACGKEKEEPNPVLRIGVFEPFSGSDGDMGVKEVLGIQYAHSLQPTIKIGSQTYDIELVYADNASSRSQAAEVAEQLLAEDVSIVLGSYGSDCSLAAAPVFEKAGVAAIGISCTAPDITAKYDCYYRVCIQDELQGAALANFAQKEVGAKTVLCIGQVENEYDQGLIKGFKNAAEALDIDVLKMDFAENTSDFTYFLSSIPEQGVDAVFAPCAVRYGKLIIEAMSELEEPVPVIGGDMWDGDAIRDTAVGKNFRIYSSSFYAEGGSKSFEQGFAEWLETDEIALANNGGTETVAAVTVMGYDAYNLALAAIADAGSPHHADILAVLPTVSSSGVSGVINFDDTGDAVRNSIYIQRADTEVPLWRFVKSQKVN